MSTTPTPGLSTTPADATIDAAELELWDPASIEERLANGEPAITIFKDALNNAQQ